MCGALTRAISAKAAASEATLTLISSDLITIIAPIFLEGGTLYSIICQYRRQVKLPTTTRI